MPTFDAGSVESRLYLDRSPFARSLSIARSMAAAFESGDFQATLGAKLDELRDGLERGKRELGDFAREKAEATLTANDRPARRALDGFDEVMRRYGRSWGQQGIRARVTADIRRAQTQLRVLERQLEQTTDPDHRIQIEAEITRARQRLEALDRLATSLGIQRPTMTVGLRGHLATAAQMFGLQRLADRLDGYNMRFKADIDRSLSEALPSVLGALEMQVMRFRTVMVAISAVTMPVFYASVGAMPAVLSAAAAGVGSLAVAVGKGGAGAGAGLIGALGLGGAALYAYGRALKETYDYAGNLTDTIYSQVTALGHAGDVLTAAKQRLDKAKEGTLAYERASRAVALAQENVRYEQQRLNILYDIATPRVRKLQKTVNESKLGMLAFGGAIMDTVAPALLLGMRRFSRFRFEVAEGALDMLEDMDKVARSFINAASRGRNLENITTILLGIKSAGVPALQAVGNGALLFLEIIAPIVPKSLSILRNIRDISKTGKQWAASARGQRTIAQTWQELFEKGDQLWRVTKNLGRSLWGVLDALDQSGTGDWLLNHAERLSKRFAELTSRTGSWHRNIKEFSRDARPILAAAGSLAKEAAKQFFRVADEVITFREEGSKLTVLEEIFKSIEDSLKPLADFLLYEFREIAPLLPDLIEELSLWFSVMAKSQPEMKFFIRFLTDMLEAFNALPDSQQRNISRVIAYAAALRSLTGGSGGGLLSSVVVGLAQVAANYWLINKRIPEAISQQKRYNQTLRNQPKVAPPPISPAAPMPAGRRAGPTIAPQVNTSRSLAKRLGERLAAFKNAILRFAGPLIGLTVVVTYDYAGAVEEYKKARKHGKDGGLSVFEGFIEGMKSVPVLGSFATWYDEHFTRILGKKDRFKEKATPVGKGIAEGIKEGVRGIPIIGPLMSSLLDGILKWWGIESPSTKAKNRIGKPIARGIIVGIAGWLLPEKLVKALNAFLSGGKRGANKKNKELKWGTVGAVIWSAIKKAIPIIGLGARLARLLGGGKRDANKKNKELKWGGIGSAIWSAIKRAIPIVGLGARLAKLLGGGKRDANKKNKDLKWGGIGSFIWSAIKRAIPIIGLGARLARLLGGGKREANEKNRNLKWGSVGRFIWDAIKRAVPLLGLGARLAQMLGTGKKKANDKNDNLKWGSVGSFIWNAIKKAVPLLGLAQRLAEFLGKGKERAKNKNDQSKWGGIGQFIWNKIKGAIPLFGLAERLADFLGKGKERANNRNDGLRWETVGSFIWNKIKGGVPLLGLGQRLSEMLGSGKQRAKDKNDGLNWEGIGNSIVAGIRTGITGNWNIGTVLLNLAKNAWERVKNFFESRSPSRLFMRLGATLPQGLAAGILNEGPKAVAAAREMARRVSEAAQTNISAPRMPSPTADGIVRLGEVSNAQWERLIKRGWKGRAGDSMEALYRPETATLDRSSESLANQYRRLKYEYDRMRAELMRDMRHAHLRGNDDMARKLSLRYRSIQKRFAQQLQNLRQETEAQNERAAETVIRATADGIVKLGEVSAARWRQLLKAGWRGRAGDRMEALYRPAPRRLRPVRTTAKPTPRPAPQAPTVSGGVDDAVADRLIAAFREEITELRRENRKISEEQAEAAVKAAFAAMQSELGRYIQDENLLKNVRATVASMPNVKTGGRK